MYQKKTYKLVIQYINGKNWQECCQLRTSTLANSVIDYIQSKWNKKICIKGIFDIPFNRETRETNFFPYSQTEIIIKIMRV